MEEQLVPKEQFVGRDLWLEARTQHKNQTTWLQSLILWLVNLMFKTRPTRAILAQIINRVDQGLVVDLSSYQPYCNVEALIDQGVQHFILRMVYIKQYIYDDWGLVEDSTYRTYFKRIRDYAAKTGKQVWIGAYVLYTAGVEDQDYVNSHVYTDAMALAMSGGYVPDYFAIDDEVNHWWQNGKEVYATPVNQVAGLMQLRRKIWNKWRKAVMHYTGKWFVSQTAGGGAYLPEYVAAFDNINRPVSAGGDGKNFPGWYAWYPQTWSQVFTAIRDVLNLLVVPTGAQEANLLSIGSYSMYELWQFSGALISNANKNAAGQPAGLDVSITRGTLADFNAALNLAAPGGSTSGSTGGSTPGNDGGGSGSETPTDLTPVLEAINNLRAEVQALEALVETLRADLAETKKAAQEVRALYK